MFSIICIALMVKIKIIVTGKFFRPTYTISSTNVYILSTHIQLHLYLTFKRPKTVQETTEMMNPLMFKISHIMRKPVLDV